MNRNVTHDVAVVEVDAAAVDVARISVATTTTTTTIVIVLLLLGRTDHPSRHNDRSFLLVCCHLVVVAFFDVFRNTHS